MNAYDFLGDPSEAYLLLDRNPGFVILPLIFVRKHLREWEGVSGSEREEAQECAQKSTGE